MIQLNAIKKNYHLGQTTVEALKNISVEIGKGDFICIAGSSGSGKTTLLNIIGCLDKQDQGNYLLDGISIDRIPERELYKIRKKYVGFIFQNFNLIPVLTAYENVEYPLILENIPREKRKELVERALQEVELFDRRRHTPDQLSGGQRQRVAIARALVKRPPVILADEPTANLDSVTGLKIIDLMKKINEADQTTFIFSTHDHNVMKHSKRTVRMIDGNIVKD